MLREPDEIMIGKKSLAEIIENHKHWLKEDCSEWVVMRANLSYADLSYVNFKYVNLSYTNFCGANLKGANFNGASICYADFTSANLNSTHFGDANLKGASLNYTNLDGVSFYNANLDEAIFWGAEHIPFIPSTCPDSGSFIGFKKASGYIVKLEIPEDAKRSSAAGRKCRCDKAKVLEIQNYDGTKSDKTVVCSNFDHTFKYKVGEIITVDNFCENRWKECAPGIHFFINRQEAVNYIKR